MPRLAAFGLLALAAVGCGGSAAPVRVNAGGATFVDPLMRTWAGTYRKLRRTEIDYIKTGSGKGVGDVTARTIDFGCTDVPMSRKELEAAQEVGGDVLHVPVAMGAIAVVFNLDGVDHLTLTGGVLADIYLNKVTTWNDPAVAALNPGVPLPARTIAAVRRAESSGTTNIVSEYLSKVSPEFRDRVGSTKELRLTGGVGQQGNDGVAGFVKNNVGAVGYVELAYARKNAIPTAAVVNRAGRATLPTAATVTAAAANAMATPPTAEPYSLHDLTFPLTDADGPDSYPIVGVSYAILFARQPRDKGPAVVDFLQWAVGDGQTIAAELDYAPLPIELARKSRAKLAAVTFE